MVLRRIRRKAIGSFPLNFLIRKSKKIFLPGFQRISLYEVMRFFYHQVKKVGLTERTSAISFNFIMALPPMFIFLCTLIPYLPISTEFTDQLYGLIRDVIPGEENNTAIINFLKDILTNQRYGLLSAGFLIALFYSSNAMMGIMRAFDKNYVGFKKRTAWEARLTALHLTLILILITFISLLLLVMQGKVLEWIGIRNSFLSALIVNVRWLVIIFLFLGSISFIYREAPFVHKRWKLINAGSVLATTLMLVFIILFSYWVENFANYHQLYGPLGALLILMLLIYFNSLVLLIGFELNVSINSLKHAEDERNKTVTGGVDKGSV